MPNRAGALLLVLLLACVSRPPRETPVQTNVTPAFDPAGTFEFNAEIGGNTQSGELRFMRQEGRLTGSIAAGGVTVELRDIVVDNRTVTAKATAPEGPEVQFVFRFEDNDRYTGTLTLPGMGDARVWGARRRTDSP